MSTKKKGGAAGGGGGAADLKKLAAPVFWEERAALFDRLWAEQQASYAAKKSPIKVTLPDGKAMEAESWVNTPLDIARRISNSLPDKVVVARVNEELWDLARPLEGDCHIELLGFDDPDARHVFWHSSSHVLGYAMERVYNTRLSVGPATEDGFFYEGLTDRPVSETDYSTIEAAMSELVRQRVPFQRLVASKEDAVKLFAYTPYKSKMLATKVPEGGSCTIYRCGMLIDPCRGPHLPDTGRVKAFAVVKNSSAYYEGKAENEVLQRVYGISFPKADQLKEWMRIQEEAAKRDHRVIGRQQQLFNFNEVSPGSAFWMPHGARIYNTLVEFMRKQYRKRGFEEVISPNMYSSKLWMVSGHWDKYQENMFCTTCEREEYGLKPMNCPGHCIMYSMQQHSYRELPIRYADFGVLHRNELSGALTGLTRVRRFQQDDAHIFCRMDQLTDEIEGALGFLRDVYGVLGFRFFLRHSTRPANKLGSEETWDNAEGFLRTALNRFCGIPESLPDPTGGEGATFYYDGTPAAVKKLKLLIKQGAWQPPAGGGSEAWEENAGDGAFYGPKIDIAVEDALKRRYQCATIQLDFNLPQRFGLKYTLPSAANDAEADGEADGNTATDGAAEKKTGAGAAAAAAGAREGAERPKLPKDAKPSYETAVRDLGIDLTLDPNQARPVMIHRAILGSIERVVAILCEHYGGEWPLWLSPRQVMVIPVAGAFNDYAQSVRDRLHAEGFYADVDLGTQMFNKKVRSAQVARYNLIFIVGEKERESGSVDVRARGDRRPGSKTLDEAVAFLHNLKNTTSQEF